MADAAHRSAARETESAETKTVLVVDDSALSRDLIHHALEPQYDVIEAKDGWEGLQVIKRAHPDLVLMDIQMPVLDGYGALREVRQDSRLRDVHIIAITAYAMLGDRERVISAGFDGYIAKPIDIKALRELVNEILR